MTPTEFKAFIVAVDPNAGHYESAYRGSDAFTVWQETSTGIQTADDVHAGVMRFSVDRFTKAEDDTIADAIRAALDGNPRIAYGYVVDYEPDTGYIHHIFSCEGC